MGWSDLDEAGKAKARADVLRCIHRKQAYIQQEKNARGCERCGTGGACPTCGHGALHWHHRDPAAKSFRLSSSQARCASWERIKAEIARCEVLCHDCHRIEHTI